MNKRRDVAPTIVIDPSGRLLLQRRDNIPNILYPGKIGFFGGHREAGETFLECAVRELREELSYEVAPGRLEYLGAREGLDPATQSGLYRAEYFLVQGVPVEELVITEGALHIQEFEHLDAIRDQLTPSTQFGLELLARRTEQWVASSSERTPG